MQRLSTYGLLFGLATGACLFSLFLFEAGLRLFHPQIIEVHPNGLWQLSQTRGAQLTPGFDGAHVFADFNVHITINEAGYRDRLYGPKQPGVFRILTIGDSFTFGFGVEDKEAFSKVLESMLNQQSNVQTFEVINGGAPGYSTHQELMFLKEVGLALEPDLVLIGFYPFNDIRDNQLPIGRYELAYGYLYDKKGYEMVRQAEKTGLSIPFKGYLWAHSHGYRFLADRHHKLMARWDTPLEEEERGKEPIADEPAKQQIPSLADQVVDLKTSQLFQEIADITRENGGQAVMLLIPDIKQVGNPEAMWIPQWNLFKEMAEKMNMPVVDLTPAFVAAGQAGQTPELWYLINKHWKAKGHQLAAETILQALQAQQLIP